MTDVNKKWDPRKMFDMSVQELDLIKRRKALALENKHEYRRLKQNPFSGPGNILDPAMQRWYSARNTAVNHFRPNTKNNSVLFFSYILPVTVLTYLVVNDKRSREANFREGNVPTKDKVKRLDLYFF